MHTRTIGYQFCFHILYYADYPNYAVQKHLTREFNSYLTKVQQVVQTLLFEHKMTLLGRVYFILDK
jgi:hypothetical protein